MKSPTRKASRWYFPVECPHSLAEQMFVSGSVISNVQPILEVSMRQLALVLTMVALNCTSVLAQQKDQPIVILSTTDPASAAAPLNLSSPGIPSNKPKVGDPTRALDQLSEQVGNFVFVGGALYMRSMMGGGLIAVPGGGASGCFSMDLPQRITGIEDFIRRLEAQKQVSARPSSEQLPSLSSR